VPSLYLRDWPDIYIHTDHDTLLEIDATKLRRVALLGAASGYSLATLNGAQLPMLLPFLAARAEQRLAKGFERAQALAQDSNLQARDAAFEAHNLIAQMLRREQAALQSLAAYAQSNPKELTSCLDALQRQAATLNDWLDGMAATRGVRGSAVPGWHASPDGARVPKRVAEFGPLTYQNNDVLLDRLGSERMRKIKLLHADSSRLLNAQDSAALYAYEIVNFIDGRKSVAEIRDAVAAEFGPIALSVVADYLAACEEAKLIAFR